MKIGVLAVQGDFAEHIAVLRRLNVECQEVRLPEQLEGIDGLIVPGGESTTLSRLMSIYHLREPVAAMAKAGKAVWGTCAGMIMLAHEITEADPVPLQLMDIGVQRNAFGRQIDSFEQDLEIHELDGLEPAGLEPGLFHAIFIRAPVVIRVGDSVKTLAMLPNGKAVAVQQGNLMATSFHPELTNDNRLHQYFLNLAASPAADPGPGQGTDPATEPVTGQ
ncbi:MAG: pyridoxal 5'-phosphate synthase glutaminase subunit PdxT [Chloroflexi bacterium]|nr:pyridoxal 5'-phosphate synthase glutaminase subunit PdxT [Chloroflexota bacterium]